MSLSKAGNIPSCRLIVIRLFMCMRMRMCVLVYVCAGVCEHVAQSCVHVCRAFVGMPCVNVYLYTKKIHQTGHCE